MKINIITYIIRKNSNHLFFDKHKLREFLNDFKFEYTPIHYYLL